MNSRQLEDGLEEAQVATLARELGVTPEALADSHYDLEAHEDDDGLFLGWIITFRSEPPEGLAIPLNGSGPGAWAQVVLPAEPEESDA